MTSSSNLSVQALQWSGRSLKVLDQRQLPESIAYDEYQDAGGIAEAIASMRVRGAPAIGIAAAYGVVLSAMQHYPNEDWRASRARHSAIGRIPTYCGQFILGPGQDAQPINSRQR